MSIELFNEMSKDFSEIRDRLKDVVVLKQVFVNKYEDVFNNKETYEGRDDFKEIMIKISKDIENSLKELSDYE